MENGAENVGQTSHDDYEPNYAGCNGESPLNRGEDSNVEQQNGTFGKGYGKPVDDHPSHKPLLSVSSYSKLSMLHTKGLPVQQALLVDP